MQGILDENYGSPIYSSRSLPNKGTGESVGADSVNIGSYANGDMVLGDNKLSVTLKSGDLRELTDDEYHFSKVWLPAFDSKQYELYVATTQDELYGNYRLYTSGTLDRDAEITFSGSTVKAFYVKVIGIDKSCTYIPHAFVTFHFDSETELAKPTNEQIDPEKYITNYLFLRYFIEQGGTKVDVAGFDRYEGTFAQRLRQTDISVFGSVTYRDPAEVWLKTSATYLSSNTDIQDFSNSAHNGFSTNVISSGSIHSDESGTLKKFSMITAFPSQLKIDPEFGKKTDE